jgi:hypothetical protein
VASNYGIREVRKKDLMWELGDGASVPALGQPWFQGCEAHLSPGAGQINIMVADLISTETVQWNDQ